MIDTTATSAPWQRRVRRRAVLAGSAAMLVVACSDSGTKNSGSNAGTSGASGTTAAATGAAATRAPSAGGVYRIGTSGGLGTLDPHNSPNAVNGLTTPVVYNYLLRASVLAKDAGIIWDLATANEMADPTTWTFKLRPDVIVAQNSKGIPQRPLDAEDVKLNMERGADPKTGSPGVRWLRGWVDRVEAVDKSTVKVITKGPYAWVIPNLGNYTFAAIAPREWLSSGTIKMEAVGGGPFTIEEFKDGAGSRLKKNPAYYIKDRPFLDGYEVRQFADQTTLRTAFVSGQLESYGASNIDEAKALQRSNKDMQLSEDPAFGYHSFWMNVRVAPWNDPRLRRAVSLAVNRQEYIQIIGRNQGEPIGPITAPMKPYALSQDELEKLQPFDLAQARQLFQAAGVKEFSFVHSTANVIPDYVNIFIRQMQAAGVTAKAEPMDPGTWAQGLFQNKHTASHVVPPEFTDPDFAMNAHGTKGPIGSDNYATGFSDPEIDAGIARAAGTLDEAQRVKAYQDLQRLVLQKSPAWFNYFAGRANNLAQPYVRGLRAGIGQLSTAYTKDYWLDK